MDHHQQLMIGNQRVNVDAMSAKVKKDIAFLQDRIARMRRQRAPNQVVVETYESMLASRQSVLAWLQQHGAGDVSDRKPYTEVHKDVHKNVHKSAG
ncbi:hypothetical protein [Exilibacterium tricleocarpae]|uniref:hypothetical protein n=1 Tax=Exilibacterium tricleocarpae TaxID=2591008 RepID=UPI001FE4994C|nr:hypothetical protein [Exilibacterium tricleocarpae]